MPGCGEAFGVRKLASGLGGRLVGRGLKPVTSYRTPKPGGSWMRLGVAKLLESEKLASGFAATKASDLNVLHFGLYFECEDHQDQTS